MNDMKGYCPNPQEHLEHFAHLLHHRKEAFLKKKNTPQYIDMHAVLNLTLTWFNENHFEEIKCYYV